MILKKKLKKQRLNPSTNKKRREDIKHQKWLAIQK
jgi:hypothetical protein